MMNLVLAYYDSALEALNKGADIEGLVKLPVREQIGRFKYVSADHVQTEYNSILSKLSAEIEELLQKEDY